MRSRLGGDPTTDETGGLQNSSTEYSICTRLWTEFTCPCLLLPRCRCLCRGCLASWLCFLLIQWRYPATLTTIASWPPLLPSAIIPNKDYPLIGMTLAYLMTQDMPLGCVERSPGTSLTKARCMDLAGPDSGLMPGGFTTAGPREWSVFHVGGKIPFRLHPITNGHHCHEQSTRPVPLRRVMAGTVHRPQAGHEVTCGSLVLEYYLAR